jgi:CDP-glycerol glycerophosphotransferase (TagB/SpsB family)
LKIRDIISHANNAMVMDKEDINSVFNLTDLAIFDNSAVTVDFLAFDKPMLMTDYFYRQKEIVAGKSKIITACESIDDNNYEDVLTLIKRGLEYDPKAEQRSEMKRYFLGDHAHGVSTSLFVDKIKDIIRMREALVACQQQGDDVLPFNVSTSALG